MVAGKSTLLRMFFGGFLIREDPLAFAWCKSVVVFSAKLCHDFSTVESFIYFRHYGTIMGLLSSPLTKAALVGINYLNETWTIDQCQHRVAWPSVRSCAAGQVVKIGCVLAPTWHGITWSGMTCLVSDAFPFFQVNSYVLMNFSRLVHHQSDRLSH